MKPYSRHRYLVKTPLLIPTHITKPKLLNVFLHTTQTQGYPLSNMWVCSYRNQFFLINVSTYDSNSLDVQYHVLSTRSSTFQPSSWSRLLSSPPLTMALIYFLRKTESPVELFSSLETSSLCPSDSVGTSLPWRRTVPMGNRVWWILVFCIRDEKNLCPRDR